MLLLLLLVWRPTSLINVTEETLNFGVAYVAPVLNAESGGL